MEDEGLVAETAHVASHEKFVDSAGGIPMLWLEADLGLPCIDVEA